MDALELAPDDPRPLTITGGLPYFGGPGNNYSMHAIAAAVDRDTCQPRREGLRLGTRVVLHEARDRAFTDRAACDTPWNRKWDVPSAEQEAIDRTALASAGRPGRGRRRRRGFRHPPRPRRQRRHRWYGVDSPRETAREHSRDWKASRRTSRRSSAEELVGRSGTVGTTRRPASTCSVSELIVRRLGFVVRGRIGWTRSVSGGRRRAAGSSPSTRLVFELTTERFHDDLHGRVTS